MEVDPVDIAPSSIELNADVLLKIFELLSVYDRKNVRLVCRQWLEVCNSRKFRENEAFFFNASYSFQTITKIIMDSGREFVNLKLQTYALTDESNCLWQTCGSKIKSLELRMCFFGQSILGHIFVSCPNMTNFSVFDGGYDSGTFPFPVAFLNTKFMHPKENDIKREKMESLGFVASMMPIIYPDLNRIEAYFPNLKKLSINLSTEDPLEKKKDLMHFHFLLKILSSETSQIDTLYVHFDDLQSYMFNELPIMKLKCMRDHDLSKLKKVGMNFVNCTLNDDSLNTILHYKFWTSLKITMHRIPQEKFNKFLIKLLEECPSLLHLGTYWKITKQSQFFDVFPSFVKSKLKNLTLDIDDRRLPESHANSLVGEAKNRLENLTKNYTVRYLSLECAEAEGFSSIFVEHFPNVSQLKLTHGNLKTIFSSLKKLKSIEVGDYASYFSCFEKTTVSIKGLQYMRSSIFDFKHSFSKVEFPDLKYMNLTFTTDELFIMRKTGDLDEYYDGEDYEPELFSKMIGSLLSVATQRAPNLRGICYNFVDLNDLGLKCETGNLTREVLAEFFKSCRNLHKLRYLWAVVESAEVGAEFSKPLILDCYKDIQSLRAAYCITQRESVSSFFNVLENKVEFYEPNGGKDLSYDFDLMEYWEEGR